MHFCEEQVGTKDMVALKGCMNYVGYHIIEEDHLACCPSAVCDEWLDEMLENMDVDLLELDEDELFGTNETEDDLEDHLDDEDMDDEDMDDEF
jgi:hypothetical protein